MQFPKLGKGKGHLGGLVDSMVDATPKDSKVTFTMESEDVGKRKEGLGNSVWTWIKLVVGILYVMGIIPVTLLVFTVYSYVNDSVLSLTIFSTLLIISIYTVGGFWTIGWRALSGANLAVVRPFAKFNEKIAIGMLKDFNM